MRVNTKSDPGSHKRVKQIASEPPAENISEKVRSQVDFTLFIAPDEREVFERIKTRYVQHPASGRTPVMLGEVFALLAQGLRSKHILKAKPHIYPETLTLAHSYLMVHMPETYSRVVDENRATAGRKAEANKRSEWDVKVLVDENLTTALCPPIRAMIGKPRHVNLIGLRGTKDPELWGWAVNNGIDVIITKDRATATNQDLTRIAENDARTLMREHLLGELPKDRLPETSIDMVLSIMRTDLRDGKLSASYNQLPLVVHIVDDRHERGMGDMRQADYVAMLLRKHRDRIFTYIENRNTPVIVVRHKKVECGPTYNELLMNVARETMSHLQLEFMAAHGDISEAQRSYMARRLTAEFDEKAAQDPRYSIDHVVKQAAANDADYAQMNDADRLAFAKRAYTERVFSELTAGFNLSADRIEQALEMAKAVANRIGPGSAPMGKLITRREGATPIYVRGPGTKLP